MKVGFGILLIYLSRRGFFSFKKMFIVSTSIFSLLKAKSIINFLIFLGGRGWRKGSNALQEGYGTAAALSEQGIYLAASMYRPVLQVYMFYSFIIYTLNYVNAVVS